MSMILPLVNDSDDGSVQENRAAANIDAAGERLTRANDASSALVAAENRTADVPLRTVSSSSVVVHPVVDQLQAPAHVSESTGNATTTLPTAQASDTDVSDAGTANKRAKLDIVSSNSAASDALITRTDDGSKVSADENKQHRTSITVNDVSDDDDDAAMIIEEKKPSDKSFNSNKSGARVQLVGASLAATRQRRTNYGSRLAENVAAERAATELHNGRGSAQKKYHAGGDDSEGDDDFEPSGGGDSDSKKVGHRASSSVRANLSGEGSSSRAARAGAGGLQQLLHEDYEDEEDDDDYVGDADTGSDADDDGDDDGATASDSQDAESGEKESDDESNEEEDAGDVADTSGNSIEFVGEKNVAVLSAKLKGPSAASRQSLSLLAPHIDADDVIRTTKQFVSKLLDERERNGTSACEGGSGISENCSVCFHNYTDEDNDLVACDRCGLTVHESCYGICDPTASPRAFRSPVSKRDLLPTAGASSSTSKLDNKSLPLSNTARQPAETDEAEGSSKKIDDVDDDAASVHSNYSTVPWFCDPCLAGVDGVNCVACAATEGAFKETDNGKWIHVICATQLHCQYYDDSNYRFAKIGRWPALGATRPCFACRDNFEANMGQTFQCQSGMCTRHLHATCAFRLGCCADEYSTNAAGGVTIHVAQIIYCPEHVERENRRRRQRDYIVCTAQAAYRRERMLAAEQKQRNKPTIVLPSSAVQQDDDDDETFHHQHQQLAFWNEDEGVGGAQEAAAAGMSDELRARNSMFYAFASQRYAEERNAAQRESAANGGAGQDNVNSSANPIPYQACGEFVRVMQARALQLGYNPRPLVDPAADTLGAYRFDRSSASFSAEFVAHVRQRDLKLEALDDAISITAARAQELCSTQNELLERRMRVELECRRRSRLVTAETKLDEKAVTASGECKVMHAQARRAAGDIRRIMQSLAKVPSKYMTLEERAAIDHAHRAMLGDEAPITTVGNLIGASSTTDTQQRNVGDEGNGADAGMSTAAAVRGSGRGRPRKGTRGGLAAWRAKQRLATEATTSDSSPLVTLCVHCNRLGGSRRDMVECAECHVFYHKTCLESSEHRLKGGSGWKGFQFICKECDDEEDTDEDADDIDDADDVVEMKPVDKRLNKTSPGETKMETGPGKRKQVMPQRISNSVMPKTKTAASSSASSSSAAVAKRKPSKPISASVSTTRLINPTLVIPPMVLKHHPASSRYGSSTTIATNSTAPYLVAAPAAAGSSAPRYSSEESLTDAFFPSLSLLNQTRGGSSNTAVTRVWNATGSAPADNVLLPPHFGRAGGANNRARGRPSDSVAAAADTSDDTMPAFFISKNTAVDGGSSARSSRVQSASGSASAGIRVKQQQVSMSNGTVGGASSSSTAVNNNNLASNNNKTKGIKLIINKVPASPDATAPLLPPTGGFFQQPVSSLARVQPLMTSSSATQRLGTTSTGPMPLRMILPSAATAVSYSNTYSAPSAPLALQQQQHNAASSRGGRGSGRSRGARGARAGRTS